MSLQLNRTSADRWQLFAPHRERVTDLALASIRAPAARACVLGAGNCNDIDLRRMAGACAEIHLVDIDGEALGRGLERQGRFADGAVVLHAGVDLTGIAGLLDPARRPSLDPDALDPDALIRSADAVQAAGLPGDFDFVLSCGVLTQLVGTAASVLGEGHARLDDVALAIRAGHIRTLIDRLRPGGRALLVTEVASSESLPAIAIAHDDELRPILLRAIATGQLFTATSPAAILHWLRRERPAGARLREPGLVGPWRWSLTRRTHLLMVGMLFQRPRPGSTS